MMPNPRESDYTWMRDVLAILFDEYTETAASRLLRDDLAREAVTPLLQQSLLARGSDVALPAGEAGDNLLRGLLSLRMKFSRNEAMKKLDQNIAMRDRPG